MSERLTIRQRLRPRLGLRMLFVLTTVVACWFGYYANWIRERRLALEERTYLFISQTSEVKPPGLLWLFGEQGYERLELGGDVPHEEVERVQRLYPEAIVYRAEFTTTPEIYYGRSVSRTAQ